MKHLWLGLICILWLSLSMGTVIARESIDQLHEEAKQAFFAADYPTAIAKWQAALNHARTHNQTENISKFLVNLGVVNYTLGQYQSALEYYQQALVIDRQREDSQGESADLLNIGLVNYSLGQYPQALEYYQQALEIQEKIGDHQSQSDTLGNISLVYNSLGEYSQALAYGEQALALHQKFDNQSGISNDLSNLGIVYDNLGQYAKAVEYYQQALTIKQRLKDFSGIANNLANLGSAYKNLTDYPNALTHYQQALEIQKQINDNPGLSKTLVNLGAVYDSLGQYQAALDSYQAALEIQRDLDDQAGIGRNLANMGVVHDNLGQYQQALEHYQQALEIQKNVNDSRGVGNTLSNLGIVYKNLGDFSEALAYYQQALEIQRELGDHRGEANTLTNLGVVYNSLGQYPLALQHYQQALDIQTEIDDKQRISNNLSNLGVLYYNLGHSDQALGYFLNAVTLRREIGDKRGEGTDLSHLGTVYSRLRYYSKALTAYQQALLLKRDLNDQRGEGQVLSNLGSIYGNLGQDQTALEHFQQALQIDRALGDRHGEGADLANIGLMYRNFGQLQKAYTALQESVTLLEKLGTDKLWYAQRGLAAVQIELRHIKAAIRQYEQALDTIEKLRVGLKQKTDKFAFMEDKLYVYDELITLLQTLHQQQPNQGYDFKALEIFERKQGRVFLEEIGQSGAMRFGGLPDRVIQKEQSLQEQHHRLQTDLVKARNQPLLQQDRDHIKTLTQQLITLTEEQQTLQSYIQEQYPDYYALKYPQPVTVTRLQNNVLRRGELILVYGTMPESTSLWIIGPRQFALFKLPVGESELNEAVAYMREVIINRLPELIEEGYPLYQKLIPPAARPLLAEAQTLYIVPTGPLYMLPFEALVSHVVDNDKPHYLVQDYTIAYLSSASLLKILRDTQAHQSVQPRKQLLGFADPTYPPCQDSTAIRTVAKERTVSQVRTKAYRDTLGAICFPPLPETANEANTIAALFNPTHNAVYMGEAASPGRLFDLNHSGQLTHYRYLLFATHGLLPYEVDGLTQPALVLANPETEGYFTMADAFTLQLNADFINLSACNTGGGKSIKGEGILGLTRAFMYAGTPAISVTLWSVESSSAENLSIGIFEHLKAHGKPAKALRQIKLKMISGQAKQPYYRHPFYWAPFVVYGDNG